MSHLNSLFICVLPDQPKGQLRRQHRYKEPASRKYSSQEQFQGGRGGELKLIFIKSLKLQRQKGGKGIHIIIMSADGIVSHNAVPCINVSHSAVPCINVSHSAVPCINVSHSAVP